ncbi:low-density lipoprotein receptor-related protein 12 [Platysternon megacephalum]|uniref:Low-density lipoprotein receptor-related protein 12 n=1 Tax=Platysternon megacephalum TaxID=55544 RepID=A0A4D9EMU3_9SAUR|nr:low-density lipoprotein receptor-related protein 12 [Platysternon megacephalum]
MHTSLSTDTTISVDDAPPQEFRYPKDVLVSDMPDSPLLRRKLPPLMPFLQSHSTAPFPLRGQHHLSPVRKRRRNTPSHPHIQDRHKRRPLNVLIIHKPEPNHGPGMDHHVCNCTCQSLYIGHPGVHGPCTEHNFQSLP